ncbi:unnamed protein product [Auanema sp. JU1783]|nr:unnamed protein product [Auanema sp. JU1783]
MLTLFLLLFRYASAEKAHYGMTPKGNNPTLYSPEDYVIQLDMSTFNDTVFCQGDDCTAHLVEFYSDWCGHCRSFAPIYKALANDVRGWQNVVRIAAMNCADPLNEAVCRDNDVQYFPYIKYYPRNVTEPLSGPALKTHQSIAEMRDDLTKFVMYDYALNHFEDWPTFDFLGDILTYGDLWQGRTDSAQFMAIVFENHQSSLTGAQLLLDLNKHKDRLAARRCLRYHALAEALRITDFPSLAIFKKGERKPVLVVELRRLLLTEIENFLSVSDNDLQNIQFSSRKNRTDPCEADPDKCQKLFYVSETDILKAMRYAMYRETARTGAPLAGNNLTALHSFMNLLVDNLPVTSFSTNQTHLDRTNRAVRVFARLRDFLESKGLESEIPIEDYQREFIAAEEAAGHPFPISSDWDHCRGSTPQFRGYTCGLWTTFHTLTVTAYNKAKESQVVDFQPLPILQSIRDWVGNFFGCNHCRDHFLKMTTSTFPMETQVKTPEDVFMYLWRAHNIVNTRLRGRESEDPMYPKYQFPAPFLCSNCSTEANSDDSLVKEFLLDYYSSIKPVSSSLSSALRLSV